MAKLIDAYSFQLPKFYHTYLTYLQANYIVLMYDVSMLQERKKRKCRDRQAGYEFGITISSGSLELNHN